MSNRIGLIPMSAKPFHDGHYKLIKLAEAECDSVIVYVSLTDRLPKTKERDDVAPVYGDDMARIWKDYIVNSNLFSNKVYFELLPKKTSPVRKVYEFIESKEFVESFKECRIFSDINDIQKYEDYITSDRYPDSYDRIQFVGVNRKSTTDISGTEIRKMIKSKDKASVAKYMPSGLSDLSRNDIANILIDSIAIRETVIYF